MKDLTEVSAVSNFLTSHRISLIYSSLFLGICELFVAWNYFSNNLVSKFSWVPDDTFVNSPDVLGVHSFSDLTSMTAAASSINPYDAPYFTAYPPFVMFILKCISSILPINMYIFIIFLLGFISLWPVWHAARNHKHFTVFVAFIIGSIPFISMLDRGNLIALLPLPLYLFYTNLERKKLGIAAAWLSVAIGIKFYIVIVLLFLLARREYRVTFYTLMISTIMNFLIFLTWGNPIKLFFNLARNIVASGASVSDIPSLNRIDATASFLSLMRTMHLDFLPQYSWIINHSNYFNFTILIIMIVVSRVSLSDYWFLLALIALQLTPNPSYPYTGVWICVGIPIMLAYESERSFLNSSRKKILDHKKSSQKGRNLLFENIFWVFLFLNSSLIFVYRNNSNLLPSLGFTILFIFLLCSLSRTFIKKVRGGEVLFENSHHTQLKSQ